ncbi:hypothetical protein PINS_up004081 [Pythium insidiosum]|nr:hypothetical protein PINS_up004081 [Pythium insidiosum]
MSVSKTRPGSSPKLFWRERVTRASRLGRRLVTVAAAIYYAIVAISAGYHLVRVLRGVVTPWDEVPYTHALIMSHLGHGSIRESPLLAKLQLETTSVNITVYLQSEDEFSFDGCPAVKDFNAWMYSDAFLRRQFELLVADTSYNWTFLATSCSRRSSTVRRRRSCLVTTLQRASSTCCATLRVSVLSPS